MANKGIGPFADGEVPSALQYKFLNNDGVPLNLAGGVATFRIHGETRTATVFDASGGIVEYLWEPDDLTSGVSDVEFKVVQGDTVTKSQPLTLLCRPAVA